MTVRRSGPRVPAEASPEAASDGPPATSRPSAYATLLDRVDSLTGRESAGDVELQLVQVFAVVWAVLGYVVWMTMWLTWKVLVLTWRAISSPWRSRPDEHAGWTTTMKYKGRVR